MPCGRLTIAEYNTLKAQYPNQQGYPPNPDGSPPDFCGCPTLCSSVIDWGQWKPIVNGYDPCVGPYNCGGNTSVANYQTDSFFAYTSSPDCPGMAYIAWDFQVAISCDKQGNYMGNVNSLWSWGGPTGSRCQFLFSITTDQSGTPQITNMSEFVNIDPRTDSLPCSSPDPTDPSPWGAAQIPGPFPCQHGCPTTDFGTDIDYPTSCCDVKNTLPEYAYWIPKCDTPTITWVRI